MERSYGFPGWCAICRWTAVGAISVATMAVLGAATSGTGHNAAPTVVRLAALPEGSGLDSAGWTVRDPAEQRRALDVLQSREKAREAARRAAAASTSSKLSSAGGTSIVSRTAFTAPTAPSAVTIPASALGQGTTLAAPKAVSVAIRFALAQVGKPYVWGATGPDSYDCSGLVQRSYAMAGIALPRTSREQARVGTAVDLPDLLPGDLLFWAYNPSDLSTVHHVAMYLGDGKIVQSPQPGEFVEVTTMWLSGYAGAVRVATGPATAALPPVPVGVPNTGQTPAGDVMPDGSPPPSLPTSSDSPPRIHQRAGASASADSDDAPASPAAAPGTSAPGTTAPGTTAPGTGSPGTTAPGSPGSPGSQGTTTPGTTSPGSPSSTAPAPGGSSPATTSTSAPGSSAPAGSHEPSGSATGTGAPATSSAAPATSSAAPDPTTPAAPAPTSSAASTTTPPPTTPQPPPPTTPTSTTPPPAPSASGEADSDSAAPATTTSAPPKPSVSPSSATPSST